MWHKAHRLASWEMTQKIQTEDIYMGFRRRQRARNRPQTNKVEFDPEKVEAEPALSTKESHPWKHRGIRLKVNAVKQWRILAVSHRWLRHKLWHRPCCEYWRPEEKENVIEPDKGKFTNFEYKVTCLRQIMNTQSKRGWCASKFTDPGDVPGTWAPELGTHTNLPNDCKERPRKTKN